MIPCFDDGATLPETLASLAAQEPVELVVVDDGSTDRATLDLLERLEADGLRVVRQENQGLAGARMTGVAATTARYVQPLDADDLLADGAVAVLADALDARPDAMVAWGDVAFFGAFELVVRTADGLDPWYLWYLDELPGTSMVRRSALEQTGGWTFPRAYEDWDFWMTLAEAGHGGVRVPAVVLHYRRDPARMSAGGLAHHGALLDEIRGRHPRLRRELLRNWRRSRAPLRARLLFPLLEVTPGLSGWSRHRLRRLVAHPRQVLAHRRIRFAAERAGP